VKEKKKKVFLAFIEKKKTLLDFQKNTVKYFKKKLRSLILNVMHTSMMERKGSSEFLKVNNHSNSYCLLSSSSDKSSGSPCKSL